MGINVCIMVTNVTAEYDGDKFEGKVRLKVVDEDDHTLKSVEWYLGGLEEFELAANSAGKIAYAVVETIGGIPKLWFLPTSPFTDGTWREELFANE